MASFYDDVMRMERARLGEDTEKWIGSGINEKKYAGWARDIKLQERVKEGETDEASFDA